MAKIIAIEGNQFKIGGDDGLVTTVSAASIQYTGAKVGDIVDLFKDGDNYIVLQKTPAGDDSAIAMDEDAKKIDKHIFVWVGSFLFGWLGVDRFMRGQVGLGVVKLLFNFLTLGIWSLVDWIVAMSKAYGAVSRDPNFIFFDKFGNYI